MWEEERGETYPKILHKQICIIGVVDNCTLSKCGITLVSGPHTVPSLKVANYYFLRMCYIMPIK